MDGGVTAAYWSEDLDPKKGLEEQKVCHVVAFRSNIGS